MKINEKVMNKADESLAKAEIAFRNGETIKGIKNSFLGGVMNCVPGALAVCGLCVLAFIVDNK